MNQSDIIKAEIIKCIDEGETDKRKIYSKVVERLGVARPTVRRCARSLVQDLNAKVQVLTSELDPAYS